MRIRVFLTFLFAVALPFSALGQVSGGSTNSTLYSYSTAEIDTTHNTVVSQRVDTFALELIGRMQGGSILYDQTLNVAFADPSVQAAIGTLQGVLTGSGATSFLGPNLLSTNTSLFGSVAQTVENRRDSPIINNFVATYVGPWTLSVGDLGNCESYALGPRGSGPGQASLVGVSVSNCTGGSPVSFTLAGGQMDIDITGLSLVDIYTTTTTTDTFLTRWVYELEGVAAPVASAVPEPASLGLTAVGLLALAFFGGALRRKILPPG